MFHSLYWNVILLIIVTISHGFGREQVCSKFHYEEQLLEKMIRQEIKVQEMENEIKKTLKSISTFMDNMEQKMEGYKDDMKDRKNELQLLADKVDIPRVAFNVYNVNDVNIVKKGQVFIFTTILLNEGNGYDSSTGIFTASVAGLYHFTAHVCNYAGKLVLYGIIVDDKTVAASAQYDSDNHTCSSVSAITVLKSGSSVSVQSTYSKPSNILYQQSVYRRVSFSGALLHK